MTLQNACRTLAILAFAVSFLTGCEKSSQEADTGTKVPTTQPVGAEADAEQTRCPIGGKPINEDVSLEHDGKTVYFCCPHCREAFEHDPDKYLSKLPQFGGKEDWPEDDDPQS